MVRIETSRPAPWILTLCPWCLPPGYAHPEDSQRQSGLPRPSLRPEAEAVRRHHVDGGGSTVGSRKGRLSNTLSLNLGPRPVSPSTAAAEARRLVAAATAIRRNSSDGSRRREPAGWTEHRAAAAAIDDDDNEAWEEEEEAEDVEDEEAWHSARQTASFGGASSGGGSGMLVRGASGQLTLRVPGAVQPSVSLRGTSPIHRATASQPGAEQWFSTGGASSVPRATVSQPGTEQWFSTGGAPSFLPEDDGPRAASRRGSTVAQAPQEVTAMQQSQKVYEEQRRAAMVAAMKTPRIDSATASQSPVPVGPVAPPLRGTQPPAAQESSAFSLAARRHTHQGGSSHLAAQQQGVVARGCTGGVAPSPGMLAAARASAAASSAAASLAALLPLSLADLGGLHRASASPQHLLLAPPYGQQQPLLSPFGQQLPLDSRYLWTTSAQTDPEHRDASSQSPALADAGTSPMASPRHGTGTSPMVSPRLDIGTSPIASPRQARTHRASAPAAMLSDMESDETASPPMAARRIAPAARPAAGASSDESPSHPAAAARRIAHPAAGASSGSDSDSDSDSSDGDRLAALAPSARKGEFCLHPMPALLHTHA